MPGPALRVRARFEIHLPKPKRVELKQYRAAPFERVLAAEAPDAPFDCSDIISSQALRHRYRQ
jgi:hypothetical protein